MIADTHKVCNFPSRPEIDGSELGEKMKDHAEKYGAEVHIERVTEIEENDNFELKTNLSEEYEAKNLAVSYWYRKT